MEVSCEIIKDLLPLYKDNSCSMESHKLVEEHIKDCHQCGELLEAMYYEPIRPVYNLDEALDETKPSEIIQKDEKKDKSMSFMMKITLNILICAIIAVSIFVVYNSYRQTPKNSDILASDIEKTDSEERSGSNRIFVYEPRGEAYKLLGILTSQRFRTPFIVGFDVTKDYKTISIQCDEYLNGELANKFIPKIYAIDETFDYEGMMAAVFDGNTISLNLEISSGSQLTSFGGFSSNGYDLMIGQVAYADKHTWNGSCKFVGTKDIEDNKEINLFVYASDANQSFLYSADKYTKDSELLGQYDYLCIVSCMFSKQAYQYK